MNPRALVIGYGNPLRRDDGAGQEVARRIEALALPGVEVIEAHQLLPEHAARLARCECAVFVDASVEDNGAGVEVREVRPAADASLAPHSSDPPALLALAFLLFDRAPRAWLVTIPACDLGLGEGLSDTAAAACAEAVAAVQQLCASASPERSP